MANNMANYMEEMMKGVEKELNDSKNNFFRLVTQTIEQVLVVDWKKNLEANRCVSGYIYVPKAQKWYRETVQEKTCVHTYTDPVGLHEAGQDEVLEEMKAQPLEAGAWFLRFVK